jgi:UDP-N-acetylmuramyl pentapeptide synthase
MLELGASSDAEHLALGAFVAGGPWGGLVTVGPMGRRIADGAEEAGLGAGAAWRCEDAEQAARVLRERTKAGDAVLLKGSRRFHLEAVLEHLMANQEA